MVGLRRSSLTYLIVLILFSLLRHVRGGRRVPCIYVFGDSLSDNGNNNERPTLAKVNYPPYGIDFPDGPTGRFTNGRTIIDVLAKKLGFEQNEIPPFATAKWSNNLTSVNYASGGGGIRNETGRNLLENHKLTISRLGRTLGGTASAVKQLNQCLYTVNIGSNDYINNYFMPQFYPTSRRYTPEQYAKVLADQYSQQLRTLYGYGARKMVIFGVGPIGCTPFAISTYGTNGTLCVKKMNAAARMFNDELEALVDRLRSDLPHAKFTYISPDLPGDLLISRGFLQRVRGCCPVSEIGQCIPDSKPCKNRLLYAFWDGFHPTEGVNVVAATLAYVKILASGILTSALPDGSLHPQM